MENEYWQKILLIPSYFIIFNVVIQIKYDFHKHYFETKKMEYIFILPNQKSLKIIYYILSQPANSIVIILSVHLFDRFIDLDIPRSEINA